RQFAQRQRAQAPLTQSLHKKILDDVHSKIVTGEWPAGHRIPFETDLAKHYGCSRMTVNKALSQLSRAGLLERNKKWGTFVKEPQTLSAALEISDIRKEVEDAGKTYSYSLLSDTVRASTDREAQQLDLSRSDPVRDITCLHFADSEPFCLEERIINVGIVPGLKEISFDSVSPGLWMLRNIPWNIAEHQIHALAADGTIAETLKVPDGYPCLVVERKTRRNEGFVTIARLFYPGDKHRLVASFTPTGAG
ncbi:MAG: histidine utilization repressor, partial [Pseudomonadota bacterium]